jgi:hypothetical protein
MKKPALPAHKQFWSTWSGAFAICLGIAILVYLVTRRTSHFFTELPFGVLILCPLMHLLLHHRDSAKSADIVERDAQDSHL